MFDEIDYILEAKNAERFAELYGYCPGEYFQPVSVPHYFLFFYVIR